MIVIAITAIALAIAPGLIVGVLVLIPSGILTHLLNRIFGPLKPRTEFLLFLLCTAAGAFLAGLLLPLYVLPAPGSGANR